MAMGAMRKDEFAQEAEDGGRGEHLAYAVWCAVHKVEMLWSGDFRISRGPERNTPAQ